MLGLLVIFLLAVAIALFAYAEYRPRQSLRNRMDTTSIDMRRADDRRGDGNPEDPSMTWFFTNY